MREHNVYGCFVLSLAWVQPAVPHFCQLLLSLQGCLVRAGQQHVLSTHSPWAQEVKHRQSNLFSQAGCKHLETNFQ